MNKGSVGRASYVIGAEVSAISDGGESDSLSHHSFSHYKCKRGHVRNCTISPFLEVSVLRVFEDCL